MVVNVYYFINKKLKVFYLVYLIYDFDCKFDMCFCFDNELFIWKSGCFEGFFFYLCLGVFFLIYSMVYFYNSCCCVLIDYYCFLVCKWNVFLLWKLNEVGWYYEMCCNYFFYILIFVNLIFYIFLFIYLYYNMYGK